jgi:hypothetical protein
MNNCAVTSRLLERRSEKQKQADEYYSAEFSVNGLEVRYQFKLWNIASMPMCVLVKEDSNILPQLQVGTTLNVKYYTSNSTHPPECLQTAIRHITKNDQGRFKGHYFVGLEILEAQE